jgi:glycolate oxidase FAD binding subunit
VRWLWAEESAIAGLRDWARQYGGHATLFRASFELLEAHRAFAPLPAAHMALMERIKSVFDPSGIFNPGRMYPSL